MYLRGFAVVLILFYICDLSQATSKDFAPSPLLLNRAYCACKCCDERPELCHMHEAIKDLECSNDLCTPEFCKQWKDAKCKTSCFCQKCQSELKSDEKYKCALYNGVPENCQCPNLEAIKCVVDKEDIEEEQQPAEMDEAMKEFEKYKKNAHCVLPCFCSKCIDTLPVEYIDECKKAGEPKSDCNCSGTACPTETELNNFRTLIEDTQKMQENGSLEQLKAHAEKITKETKELNEQLKPEIEAGKAKPISPNELKSTKCKLQCLCDKCRGISPMMDQNCGKILESREEFCPGCPEDLECPEPDGEANCKMFCFCDICKFDERMPKLLVNKCEEISQLDTSTCTCIPDEVDCNVLSKIGSNERQVLDKKNKEKYPDKEKTDKKGKIKKKTRMWDEL